MGNLRLLIHFGCLEWNEAGSWLLDKFRMQESTVVSFLYGIS